MPRHAPLARRDAQVLVFRGALVALLVHAADDAVLHRQPGVGPGQHAVAALVALIVGGLAMVVWPSLRPGLRAGVAASLGLLGAVNGAMHVGHVRADALAASDLTGLVAAVAGVTLVVLAAVLPFAHRGERAATAGVRRRNRAIAVPLAVATLLLVVAPVGMAIVDSHKWREPIPPTPAGYEDVRFEATDGLTLRGWFHPSRNGATVVVAHGGNSDRTGVLAYARMLERRGYGVLLYDARGRGESEGTPSGYGWGSSKDLEGALDHLAARDDVDPARIGGLGISTGGDVLLEVAADRPELAGVVTDGAAAMTWQDARRLGVPAVEAATGWMMFSAVAAFTGAERPRVLEDRVAAIRSPLLLISAGRAAEHDFNVLYERAAGGRAEHWNLPDADHARVLRDHPAEYERRVTGFFARTLTPNQESSP